MKAYTYEVFHRCESIADWVTHDCSLAIDSTQKIEGKYSIKMTSDAAANGSMAFTKQIDWSEFHDIIFSVYHLGWTNEVGRIYIWNDLDNWKMWNFDFAASWTEITIDLSSTPDGSDGTLDLTNVAWITIDEQNLENPGEDYYFDFFKGRSIDVSAYMEEVRIRDGIFPIIKRGSFMTHPDDEKYFRKTDVLEIYDGSDVLVYSGVIVDKNRGRDGLYRYALDSFYNEAHSLNYAKDFSSDKSSEKIQDIVDNSFDFIRRDSSITATTIDYDYSLNRPSAALINLIRFLERQVVYIEPDGLMRTKDHDGLIKTPQYYGATYNFREDDVGDFPAGWTDTSGADTTITIISELDGHKKVLQIYDNSAANTAFMYKTFTVKTDATEEFWITKDSVGVNTNLNIDWREGATTIVYLQFFENDLYYNSGGWNLLKANFLTANKLSHIKIVFDDTANTFDCYIDDVLEGSDLAYMNNSTTGIGAVRVYTDGADTGYKAYIDAWGDSWDANYKVGDNEVAWDVSSHHQNVQLIDAKEFRTGYYKGSLGITRASVRMKGNVIRTKPDDRTDTEQTIGVHALKEYRDLKLVANAEADQLATNLFDIFSLETEFLSLRIEGEGFLPPGQTLEIRNTGAILIAKKDFLIISFTYDPKSDIYLEMIVSSNVVLPSEFTSNFDTSPLQIHQANLQTFENATDVATNATDIATKCVMATGTYTGNAVDNRQFTGLGFSPKSMMLQWTNVGNLYYKDDQMGEWKVRFTRAVDVQDNFLKFIADGFEVDNNNNNSNNNGDTYTYTAWG